MSYSQAIHFHFCRHFFFPTIYDGVAETDDAAKILQISEKSTLITTHCYLILTLYLSLNIQNYHNGDQFKNRVKIAIVRDQIFYASVRSLHIEWNALREVNR